jgi:hypothetical protein
MVLCCWFGCGNISLLYQTPRITIIIALQYYTFYLILSLQSDFVQGLRESKNHIELGLFTMMSQPVRLTWVIG